MTAPITPLPLEEGAKSAEELDAAIKDSLPVEGEEEPTGENSESGEDETVLEYGKEKEKDDGSMKTEDSPPDTDPKPGPGAEPQSEEVSLEDRKKAYSEKYQDNPEKLAEAGVFLQQMQTKQGLQLGEARQETDVHLKLIAEQEFELKAFREQKGQPEKLLESASTESVEDLLLDGETGKVISILKKELLGEIKGTLKQDKEDADVEVAKTYNESLINTRRRQALLKLATDLGQKDAIIRYSDESLVVSPEESKPIDARINKESDWITDNLLPGKDFKYASKAFDFAKTALYGADNFSQAKKNGAQEVLSQLEKPDAGAVIMSPKGGGKTESNVDMSKIRTAADVNRIAPKLSDKELDEAINASRPRAN